MLNCYKEYLKILEVFSNLKPLRLAEKSSDYTKTLSIMNKLKEKAVQSYCKLVLRHPHFNYRLNIVQSIMPKIAANEEIIRQTVSRTVAQILKLEDNSIITFKLDLLKELHKAVKSRPHIKMESWLLDCLILHDIMVDETKAKVIDESTKRTHQLHD